MKSEVKELLEKAKRSLSAAEKIFEDGFYDFAMSRAYYAMLYAAEALLLTKELAFSKHSAVIAAFGEHFIKSSKLPKELHANFRKAFDKRAKGDYSLEVVSYNEAREIISYTKDFLSKIEHYIGTSQNP